MVSDGIASGRDPAGRVRVPVLEPQRADARDLRDVLAGLRPVEVVGVARQHDDAPRRMRAKAVGVEPLARPM